MAIADPTPATNEQRRALLLRLIGWSLVGLSALLVAPTVLWCAFASAGFKGSPDRSWVELFRGDDVVLATWPVYPTALVGFAGLLCLFIAKPFARPGTPTLALVVAAALLAVSGSATLLSMSVFSGVAGESPPFTSSPLSAAFLLPHGYCAAGAGLLAWLGARELRARRRERALATEGTK
jgi:hypothetical protein